MSLNEPNQKPVTSAAATDEPQKNRDAPRSWFWQLLDSIFPIAAVDTPGPIYKLSVLLADDTIITVRADDWHWSLSQRPRACFSATLEGRWVFAVRAEQVVAIVCDGHIAPREDKGKTENGKDQL